jgi:hypothetical protein
MAQAIDPSTATSNTPPNTFFNRIDVLRCPNEDLYSKISTFTTGFAILGYSDTASTLVGLLNKHDWHHRYHLKLKPLRFLWDDIGQWPDGELDRVRQEMQKERERLAKQKVKDEHGEDTGKKIRLEVDESPITDADIKKDLDRSFHSYAISWWYPERPHLWAYGNVEYPPSPHDQEVDLPPGELVERIRVLIDAVRAPKQPRKATPNGPSPVNPSNALASALELRLRVEETSESEHDGIPTAEDILGMIAKRLGETFQIDNLTQSRRAWPMLRSGALLKLIGLDKARVDLFASQLVSAIAERLEHGRQEPPTLSIRELVETINTNTITGAASIEFFQEFDNPVSPTILRPPASDALIAETEKRLGTTLPADYKEYLRITNGNDAAFGGVILEAPLHKCEDIRWFTDDEDYFSDLIVDIPANMARIMHLISDDGEEWPTIGRGIILGSEDIDNTFLIAPETVAEVKDKVRSILDSADAKVTEEIKKSVRQAVQDFSGSMEEFEALDWCCLTWASGGAVQMDGYSSFGKYLKHVAESSRKIEKDCWNFGYLEFWGYLLVGKE